MTEKAKNYLILGGTSGVGFSLAKYLSKHSNIDVFGRDPKKIKAFNSPNINFFSHEILSLDETVHEIKKASGEKRYDGVFVSTGSESFKRLGAIRQDDINKIFNPPIISLLSVLHLASNGELMKEDSSIVAMSSVSSERGKSGMSLYGSSRAAIESLIKHSSNELAKRKIRINGVRAGAFKSDMHQRITDKMIPDQLKEYEKLHLLGFGETKDIRDLIIFLFSEKSTWFTGSIITIDGGFLAR